MSNNNEKPLDMAKGDEGILEGLVGRDTWQYAWARAIAKAWQDEDFKKRLLEDSHAALKDFGFNTPPGLTINVEEYQGDKHYHAETGKNGWIHLKDDLAGKVVVVLPPRPDESEQAMALADYNATGLAYPFTT